MVVSNARKKIGFLHISFYKVVQIVLPIILRRKKTTDALSKVFRCANSERGHGARIIGVIGIIGAIGGAEAF